MRKLTQVLGVLLLCGLSYAQTVEVRRPTSETSTSVTAQYCAGSWISGTLPNFWDNGGSSTVSILTATGADSADFYRASVLSGFSAPSGSYSSLALKFDWACTNTAGGGCRISYSTNNGSSYTAAETVTVSGVQHTTTIALTPSVDLTQLKVKWEVCGSFDIDTPLASTIVGYDVRTEGVLAAAAGKKFQITTSE